MRKSIIIIFIITLLCSCHGEYHRNKFKIVGVSLRFIEWQGVDSLDCGIVTPSLRFRPDFNTGVAIQLKKEFYSDSIVASFIGVERLGIDGVDQVIETVSLELISSDTIIEMSSFLRGDEYQNDLKGGEEREGRITKQRCIYTEKFANLDSLISNFNKNDETLIQGEPTLKEELLFWLTPEGKNVLSTLEDVESAVLKIKFDSGVITANYLFPNKVSID